MHALLHHSDAHAVCVLHEAVGRSAALAAGKCRSGGCQQQRRRSAGASTTTCAERGGKQCWRCWSSRRQQRGRECWFLQCGCSCTVLASQATAPAHVQHSSGAAAVQSDGYQRQAVCGLHTSLCGQYAVLGLFAAQPGVRTEAAAVGDPTLARLLLPTAAGNVMCAVCTACTVFLCGYVRLSCDVSILCGCCAPERWSSACWLLCCAGEGSRLACVTRPLGMGVWVVVVVAVSQQPAVVL